MSHEKRNNPSFFPAAKRNRTTLDASAEAARQLFLNARSEHAQLGDGIQFSVTEANDILNRLNQSFQQSTENEWFHFAARKLYLDIIRKFEMKQQLTTAHRFHTEDLLNAYIELKASPLFNTRGNAEQQHIDKIIEHLSRQRSEQPVPQSTSCSPCVKM